MAYQIDLSVEAYAPPRLPDKRWTHTALCQVVHRWGHRH